MKSHYISGVQSIAKNFDTAFTVDGYRNWKKGIEKFKVHQSSYAHQAAVAQHLHSKKNVAVQLSTQHQQQHEIARNCL